MRLSQSEKWLSRYKGLKTNNEIDLFKVLTESVDIWYWPPITEEDIDRENLFS